MGSRAKLIYASLLLALAPGARAWPSTCNAQLTQQLPSWQAAVPPPDAAAWARTEGIDPVVATGDFNGDGRRDWVAIGHSGSDQFLAFCLSSRAGLRLRTLRYAGCGDLITRSLKGRRVHNFETGRDERLRSDGVGAYCFEKAGSMIVLESGRFRVFTHSD